MTGCPPAGRAIRNEKEPGFKLFLLRFQFLVVFSWEAGFKLEKHPSFLREMAQVMLDVYL